MEKQSFVMVITKKCADELSAELFTIVVDRPISAVIQRLSVGPSCPPGHHQALWDLDPARDRHCPCPQVVLGRDHLVFVRPNLVVFDVVGCGFFFLWL